MFAVVFVAFDVETVFLYLWAMSFDVLSVSKVIKALIFCAYPNCWQSLCMAKRSIGNGICLLCF